MKKYNQIKSKDRVVNHGEVYTPDWVVQDMLDMIPNNASKIETRYLESSSGEGNFLVAILIRKLEQIFINYKVLEDVQFYTFVALTNIYGIELLKDNVEFCKRRMLEIIRLFFIKYNYRFDSTFENVINNVLSHNIINMNTLTYRIPMFDFEHQLLRDENNNILYEGWAQISEWVINEKKKTVKHLIYLYKDVALEQEQRYHLENEKRIKTADKEPEQLDLLLFNEDETKANLEINLFDEKDDENFIKVANTIEIYDEVYFLNILIC